MPAVFKNRRLEITGNFLGGEVHGLQHQYIHRENHL